MCGRGQDISGYLGQKCGFQDCWGAGVPGTSCQRGGGAGLEAPFTWPSHRFSLDWVSLGGDLGLMGTPQDRPPSDHILTTT